MLAAGGKEVWEGLQATHTKHGQLRVLHAEPQQHTHLRPRGARCIRQRKEGIWGQGGWRLELKQSGEKLGTCRDVRAGTHRKKSQQLQLGFCRGGCRVYCRRTPTSLMGRRHHPQNETELILEGSSGSLCAPRVVGVINRTRWARSRPPVNALSTHPDAKSTAPESGCQWVWLRGLGRKATPNPLGS